MEGAAATLEGLPRLGWARGPSPISSLPALARTLGLEYLGIKRDDLLEPPPGGSKVRKLDFLLASEPYRSAEGWASLGAIGSGHLVALTEAAKLLGKRLWAHCFWEPLSQGVLDNLAFTASGPTELRFHRSRAALALSRPGLLIEALQSGPPVIPPGATLPVSMAGLVRAGLELAAQVRGGELPEPDCVYVALGTGGTAAGLSVGLGLGGLRCEVRAVATVERVFTSRRMLARRVAAVQRWLSERGISGAEPAPICIDRAQLGPAYGVATAQSLAACELLAGEGISLEPIYTGKAMAALLADASSRRRPRRALFWLTARKGPLPRAEGWRERLPVELSRRLDRATRPWGMGRRRLIAGGAAAAVAAIAYRRLTGYPEVAGWSGQVLSPREALVLAAAAEALIAQGKRGPSPLAVAANVDRYLATLPPSTVREVHALLWLVEHGTTPLGLRLARFTSLSPAAREAFLSGLFARGGLLAMSYRGLRDLCLMGHYQVSSTWEELGYPGPWGPAAVPHQLTPYDSFRAGAGQEPKGAAR